MKIFVTRQIPGDFLDKLKINGNEVVVSEYNRPLTYDELLTKSKGVDAIMSLLSDKIDANFILQLKIISNYAVGFDNIDIAANRSRW
jgi:glyoxylate reductase